MPWKDVSAAEAHTLLASDPTLSVLDVRTPPEYEANHIDGASLIPVQVLHQYVDRLDPSRAWLVVCEHGRRSVSACELLAQLGFANLRNLTGGMTAWRGASLPIAKGLPGQPQPPSGGCGHHCGCVGKEPRAEPARSASEAGASAGAAADNKKEKGWLRSLFGR